MRLYSSYAILLSHQFPICPPPSLQTHVVKVKKALYKLSIIDLVLFPCNSCLFSLFLLRILSEEVSPCLEGSIFFSRSATYFHYYQIRLVDFLIFSMTELISRRDLNSRTHSTSFKRRKAQNGFPLKVSIITNKIIACLVFQSCVSLMMVWQPQINFI